MLNTNILTKIIENNEYIDFFDKGFDLRYNDDFFMNYAFETCNFELIRFLVDRGVPLACIKENDVSLEINKYSDLIKKILNTPEKEYSLENMIINNSLPIYEYTSEGSALFIALSSSTNKELLKKLDFDKIRKMYPKVFKNIFSKPFSVSIEFLNELFDNIEKNEKEFLVEIYFKKGIKEKGNHSNLLKWVFSQNLSKERFLIYKDKVMKFIISNKYDELLEYSILFFDVKIEKKNL